MHAKLKRRVNKLFGPNTWQKLSQSYKDLLIHAGAHHVWREWRQHISLDEIMGDANFELEQIKVWKETNDKNLQNAREIEPLVFESLEQLNAAELDDEELTITPSGEALIKKLFDTETMMDIAVDTKVDIITEEK